MQLKKIGIAVMSMFMFFSTTLSNLSFVSAKESKFLVREYDTGYKTDEGTEIIKLRIKGEGIDDYESHWGQVAFCIEHGAPLPTGEHLYDSINITNTYKNAARIAYLSTYRYNNGESGGMQRYAYTQNLIWQVLGQTSNSHNIDSEYPAWKEKILDEYNKWDLMPSFDATKINLELGQSKTITDTNKVFQYYDTFNFTKDGVTFSHTKNSNNIVISAPEDCTKEIVTMLPSDSKNNGASKYSKSTGQANFVLRSNEVQNMICSPGFTDPRYLSLQVELDLYGSLEIAKKDDKGNYVPDVKFKVSSNADMSNPIGTYTTGQNGKVVIDKLRPGDIYIQEVSVPNHLILDSTVHKVTVKSNETATYTQVNQTKKGYIEVTKYDKKTGAIVKKAGTEFEILRDNKVIATITTDTTGKAKTGLLDYGQYIIREKKAPQNYVLAVIDERTSILEDGKTYSVSIYNEPMLGKINLEKVDKETGDKPQGDATLDTAQYVIKANKNILNPSDNSVIFMKDEVISKKKVGNSSWGDTGLKTVDKEHKITWSNLPMGEYRIEETKAGQGYLKDDAHVVVLTSDSSSQKVITQNVTSKEQVIKGQLEIAKAGHDGENGVMTGLEGIQFTMKLKSEVDKVGFDKAKTYATIVTNKQGRGTSAKVPYGIYQVRETKTIGNYAPCGDFFVNINEDKEIEYRMVNNSPFKAWLKLVKVDEDGKKVTLSGATFKIKDENGEYVSQKVGLFFNKDEWTTDESGMVALDDKIMHGHYTIEEVKTPDGFLLGNSFDFEVSADSPDLEFDKDMDAIVTVIFKNEKPSGNIILNKTFENEKDIDGAVFKLTAKETVLNSTDGSVLYEKGQVISINGIDDGLYTMKDGRIEIKDLPLNPTGKTIYQLEEISTLDGYVLLDSPIVFEFGETDDTTKTYTLNETVKNYLSEAYFSKTDLNGKEIKGGTYKVIDKETMEVIDTWTSDGQSHLIKGLVFGKEYIFYEDLAPLGYTLAKPIEFTFTENKQETTMIDTIVNVRKVDENNDDMAGVVLQVVSLKTKEIVDEWTTDGTSHAVNGLMVGQDYELREVKAPQNYIIANPIRFTVSEKEDMTIVMNNKYVEIAKIDQNNKPVENATLQIVDMESGEVIESWTTDEKGIHYATQLLAGKKYKLEEIDAPENYMLADPIEFEVSDDKNQTIIMTDVKTDIVEITKYDATNNQELEGAKLQLKDSDGNLIEEWISTKEAHAVRLTVSSQYTLIEITAPNGYEIAESITFTVDDNGEVVQKIAMKDERIPQPPIIIETGDSTNVMLYIGLMLVVSSIGFFIACHKKKSVKEHEGE